MSEMTVSAFEAAKCVPPEDNRPAERPGSDNLAKGIDVHGQLVPGLVCPHPDLPGKYLILDGVGRWGACVKLGIDFRAILLSAPVPEAERIQLRFQYNAIRKNMSMDEIADDAARYMSLLHCTQEEAAQQLTLSSATVSRALTARRRIPCELKPMAEALRPSIVSLIAALPHAEAMRQAFEHAGTPGKDGKLPTRDQVAAYLERFKKKKSREERNRTLKGTIEGRKVELAVLPGESTDAVIKFLQSLAAKLGKYRELPPDNLGFLFQV